MTGENDNPIPGGDAAPSDGTDSTDFGSGFESDIEEFVSDLPPDAGTDAPSDSQAAAGDPEAGGQADVQTQPGVQPPQPTGGQPDPSQQQQQYDQSQDALLGLDSGAPLDQLLQVLTQNENAVAQAAADRLFKLSDADREALETDAVAAMPALAGKVYVKSIQAATQLVRNMVPQMLQQEMNKQQSLMAVEQAFFAQFPELDRWKHGQDIVAVGQALRAQNPNMSAPELLKRIASAVMGMHGIQRRPARGGNGQQPFRPAQSGPVHGQMNSGDENPFAGLGLNYDE